MVFLRIFLSFDWILAACSTLQLLEETLLRFVFQKKKIILVRV